MCAAVLKYVHGFFETRPFTRWSLTPLSLGIAALGKLLLIECGRSVAKWLPKPSPQKHPP